MGQRHFTSTVVAERRDLLKVLIVASDTFPHIGGKSSHIRDLMKGFRAENVDCQLISLSSLGRLMEIMIKCPLLPLKLINVYLYNYIFTRIWSRILNRLVHNYCLSNKPDFISVQDAFAAQAILTTVKKVQITVSLTMHTYFGIEQSLDRKMNYLSRLIYRSNLSDELRALRVIDGLVAVDQRIHEHVKGHIEAGMFRHITTTAIMNFTATDVFKAPTALARAQIRHHYNISDEVFVAICARRLVEKNGVMFVVKAMRKISDDSVMLLIAGDGPQRKMIEKYIQLHSLEEKVKLLGAVDDKRVIDLYMMSDISIVPSVTVNGLQEATSISAIEAMSCGLPTIASNIGGLTQLIKSDHTGILVDEADEESIAREIGRLKKNKALYQDISINARDHVRKNHSHISAARKYLDFFERLSIVKHNYGDVF